MNSEFDIMQGIPAEEMESIENYMVWREHVGEMYSLFREKKVETETLTFDWLPEDEAVISNFEEGNNKIMVIKPEASTDPIWEHATDKEVNRARVFISNDTYIAAITASGSVLVFNYTNKSEPLKLDGHTENGFALAWSKSGLLASGDDSRKICVWKVDFEAWKVHKLAETIVEFEKKQEGETSENQLKGINDLAWLGDQLVAGCDDGHIRVFDTSLGLINSIDSNQGTVDCLAVNPFTESMLATAGSNCAISIWDIRELQEPVHVMTGHEKTIASIKFSPQVDGLLASAGEDRRVVVWDIRQIGTTQDPEEAEEALPEISFIHGGHVMMVNDLSWHPTRRWVLASVAEDCSVQVWKPNELVTEEAIVPAVPKSVVG